MTLAVSKRVTVSKSVISGLLAIGLALTVAGCATDAPPPPPPAPPPAPAGPPVALGSEIADAAAVYADYIARARTIKGDFADGASVQSQLQLGESYEPAQLARGVVAYGAIVAMQEPSFRAALRTYAASDVSRADILARLMADPAYVNSMPGADVAARRVILAISSDGQSVYSAGASVKQAAYDIQHQAWSKGFVDNRDGRLALAKTNSVTLNSVQSDHSAQLLSAALSGSGLVTSATTGQTTGNATPGTGGAPATVAPQAPQPLPAAANGTDAAAAAPAIQTFDRPDLFNQPYTATVNHALTIAAIAILGEGGPDRTPALLALLDEGDGQKCLRMSKLNLYQCLAVAKPHYEDVFCLGQHVLMDTGQCLGKMSSNALSFDPPRKMMGINEDGTTSKTAVAYLQPAKPVKCKKGKKCAVTSTKSSSTSAKKTTTAAKKPATKKK